MMNDQRGRVFVEERRHQILLQLQEQKHVTVEDLMRRCGVSGATIRNDLAWLEQHGMLRRTHGGAMPSLAPRAEMDFFSREHMHAAEKRRIGIAAAQLIQDGDIIALDASTTALEIARQLHSHRELTVITNGLRAASELADQPGMTVYIPGGSIRPGTLSIIGGWGDALLKRIHIQKAFVGANGLTLAEGLTEINSEEARLKQTLVTEAQTVIAVIDYSKWGAVSLSTFCPIERIHTIVTDERAPTNMIDQVRGRGIQVKTV